MILTLILGLFSLIGRQIVHGIAMYAILFHISSCSGVANNPTKVRAAKAAGGANLDVFITTGMCSDCLLELGLGTIRVPS